MINRVKLALYYVRQRKWHWAWLVWRNKVYWWPVVKFGVIDADQDQISEDAIRQGLNHD